jgi:TonB family protein
MVIILLDDIEKVIKRINKHLFTITKIQNDSTILYTGALESVKPLIKSGVFSFYSPSGQLEAVGAYDQNILVGEWIYLKHRMDSDGKVHYDTLDIVDYDEVHKYMSNVKNEARIHVEGMPTFNGGNPLIEFQKYVKENMIYPAYAKYEGIEGSVGIQFRINEEGNVQEPYIVNSSHNDFSTEALRLVIESTGWGPRMKDGKPVQTSFSPIIIFRLP